MKPFETILGKSCGQAFIKAIDKSIETIHKESTHADSRFPTLYMFALLDGIAESEGPEVKQACTHILTDARNYTMAGRVENPREHMKETLNLLSDTLGDDSSNQDDNRARDIILGAIGKVRHGRSDINTSSTPDDILYDTVSRLVEILTRHQAEQVRIEGIPAPQRTEDHRRKLLAARREMVEIQTIITTLRDARTNRQPLPPDQEVNRRGRDAAEAWMQANVTDAFPAGNHVLPMLNLEAIPTQFGAPAQAGNDLFAIVKTRLRQVSMNENAVGQWKLLVGRVGDIDLGQLKKLKVVTRNADGTLKIGDNYTVRQTPYDDRLPSNCFGTFVSSTNNDNDCTQFLQSCVNKSADLRQCIRLFRRRGEFIEEGIYRMIETLKKKEPAGLKTLTHVLDHFGFKKLVKTSSLIKRYYIESVQEYANNLRSRLNDVNQLPAYDEMKKALDNLPILRKILTAYVTVVNANPDLLYNEVELEHLAKNPEYDKPKLVTSFNDLKLKPKPIGTVENLIRDLEDFKLNIDYINQNSKRKLRSHLTNVSLGHIPHMYRPGIYTSLTGMSMHGGFIGVPTHLLGSDLDQSTSRKMLRADAISGLKDIYDMLLTYLKSTGELDTHKKQVIEIRDAIANLYDNFKQVYTSMLNLQKEMNVANIFTSSRFNNTTDALFNRIKRSAQSIGTEIDDFEKDKDDVVDKMSKSIDRIVVDLRNGRVDLNDKGYSFSKSFKPDVPSAPIW